MTIRRWMWCAAVWGAAALGACGDGGSDTSSSSSSGTTSSTSSSGSGTLDPCTLVTAAEASTVLGVAAGEGFADPGTEGACIWVAESDPGITLRVVLNDPTFFDQMMQAFSTEPTFEALAIGDQSFYVVQTPGNIPRVDLLVGSRYATLIALTADDPKVRLIALATEVALRL